MQVAIPGGRGGWFDAVAMAAIIYVRLCCKSPDSKDLRVKRTAPASLRGRIGTAIAKMGLGSTPAPGNGADDRCKR